MDIPEDRVWFVAPQGSDVAAGSVEQPFASLARALQGAQPGDTILLRGGTYQLRSVIKTSISGTPSAWIVIRAYPGELATLDCAQTEPDTSCLILLGQYIEINGLEIANARKSGIAVWGGSHIRLRSNWVHHAQHGGIYVGHDTPGSISDIEVDSNRIEQTCLVNNPVPRAYGSGWPAALLIGSTTHFTVTNNLVGENYGEGIIIAANHGLVADNTAFDNYSVNIYLDNAQATLVERNMVYTLEQPEFYRFRQPATGIELGNEVGPATPGLSDNIIRNNIVVGGRFGLSFSTYRAEGASGSSGGLHNTVIEHNTFYDNSEAALRIESESAPDFAHRANRIAANAFVQPTGRPVAVIESLDGLHFEHNGWAGSEPGPAAGAGDVYGEPLFSNPGGLQPDDYILLPGSPWRSSTPARASDQQTIGASWPRSAER